MEDEKAIDFELRRNQQEEEFDHFDRFMFGRSRNEEENKDQSENDSPFSKYLGQIDLDEVMSHVDTLVTSARELKPLLGKVKPLLDHLIEKK